MFCSGLSTLGSTAQRILFKSKMVRIEGEEDRKEKEGKQKARTKDNFALFTVAKNAQIQ